VTRYGTDESMWESDCKRHEKLVDGSNALLEALWEQHPRRMRIAFTYGTATPPAPRQRKLHRPHREVHVDNVQVFYERPSPFMPITGTKLIQVVADAFNISYGELIGDGRSRRYVEARAIVIQVLRERGWSYPRIGKLLGGRDHSTIIHAWDTFDIHAKRNPLVAAVFNQYRPSRRAT